jgi:hypothetical protein
VALGIGLGVAQTVKLGATVLREATLETFDSTSRSNSVYQNSAEGQRIAEAPSGESEDDLARRTSFSNS